MTENYNQREKKKKERREKKSGERERVAKEKAVERVSTQQCQGHAEATCFVAAKMENKETFIVSVCFTVFFQERKGIQEASLM